MALFLTGFERVTLCLSERSLCAQYHVEEDSMTTEEDEGRLSENSLILSSVFSTLPCLRTLPKMSMTANSEYTLCRSSPTNNDIRAGSPFRLIRDLLTYDYTMFRSSLSLSCHDPSRRLG